MNRSTDPMLSSAPTPTVNSLPLRRADFASLADALDYAAGGETGVNFNLGAGKPPIVLSYRTLREQALVLARRLLSLELKRGARVAVVAETHPDFQRLFYACQYAGLVPVGLPAAINLGGLDAYKGRLRGLLQSCDASVAVTSAEFMRFLEGAAAGLGLAFLGTPAELDALPQAAGELQRSGPEETAYLQYTSGSTMFPRGVVITQSAVLSNLAGAANHGIDVRADDRGVSWLPFYHDMGLVGCMLAPMASQRSMDYLDPRDFAMRPRRWLELMTRTRATFSFGPPFGYGLCVRRIRPEDVAQYDLRAWRVAGIGAEPIREDVPEQFARLLAPAGFDRRAFVPCYGMAEASLAISFSPLGQGVIVERVDADHLTHALQARPANAQTARVSSLVRCGPPLPGHELEIHDDDGNRLADLQIGRIKVRGPSLMSGYFGQAEMTRQVLSADGWLDSGDIGYRVDGSVVVTGRHKDMIIINGRNIWPQDIEHIVERQPELRHMDAAAFFVHDAQGEEVPVVVVQSNVIDAEQCRLLVQRLQREINALLGINCLIELVPRRTLPRTSSGKLSRATARAEYLLRTELAKHAAPERAPAAVAIVGSSDDATRTRRTADAAIGELPQVVV